MTYFKIHIQPIGSGSSDCIVVDNFHPEWKETAKRLLEGRIVDLMNEKARQISKWADIPLSVEFSQEYGLNHISLPWRAGLDLYTEPVRDAKYRSHNIHTVQEVGAVVGVITEYICWLNFAIEDIEK